VEANALAGIPDFVMAAEYGSPRRITAILEVKNPWQVTPRLVDEVIQSVHNSIRFLTFWIDQVPLTGRYPARLALEQLYGYMVRNGKSHGILTTMKGWCFARRENGGRFYVTRMFGDFLAQQGISDGAAGEGYQETTGFSILRALYYVSSLSENTPDSPEMPIGDVPGRVYLPRAGTSTTAAPLIQQPPQVGNAGYGVHGGQAPAPAGGQGGNPPIGATEIGVQIVGGYHEAECIQYDDDLVYHAFQFEPWLPESHLGPKTWIAMALPSRVTVVFKLWDAWHFGSQSQSHEASIYLHLRSLWGRYIPSLRVKSPLEFFHALIFQYIKVLPLRAV
jgi:hypothetical protein